MMKTSSILPTPDGFMVRYYETDGFLIAPGDTLQMGFQENGLVLYCECLTLQEADRRSDRRQMINKWKRRLGWFWLCRMIKGVKI